MSPMSPMVAVAGLVLVAAITPGPNNLVVLRAAARGGAAAALPAIAGILTGGLGLLAVVVAGAGAAFDAEPGLRVAGTVGGSLYLSWLGVRLIQGAASAERHDALAPSGALGLYGFQFLNPKAWLMVVTSTAAAPDIASWQLAAVFVLVPGACLAIWAAFGSALSRHLARPAVAARFDRAMGALLVASAIALVVTA